MPALRPANSTLVGYQIEFGNSSVIIIRYHGAMTFRSTFAPGGQQHDRAHDPWQLINRQSNINHEIFKILNSPLELNSPGNQLHCENGEGVVETSSLPNTSS